MDVGHLMDMGWMGWAMMGLPVVLILGLLALVLWLVVLRKDARPATASPLEMLQQRYARGEIGEAEYQRTRETLSQS